MSFCFPKIYVKQKTLKKVTFNNAQNIYKIDFAHHLEVFLFRVAQSKTNSSHRARATVCIEQITDF